VLSVGPRVKRKKEENRKRYKMDEEPVVNSPRNQFLFTTLIVPQPSDSSVPNIVNEITEREVSPTLTQRNDRLVPLREEAQPPRYSTIVEHCPKTEKPQLCVPRVLPASPFEEASVQWCVTSPWVRILRPHRSLLLFPIRQLHESCTLQFCATISMLGSDMGPYPYR
jgi:hypothetical protein